MESRVLIITWQESERALSWSKAVNEIVFMPCEGELFLILFSDLNTRENTFAKSMALYYVPESLLICHSSKTT